MYEKIELTVYARRCTEDTVETDEDSEVRALEGDFIVRVGTSEMVLSPLQMYEVMPFGVERDELGKELAAAEKAEKLESQ